MRSNSITSPSPNQLHLHRGAASLGASNACAVHGAITKSGALRIRVGAPLRRQKNLKIVDENSADRLIFEPENLLKLQRAASIFPETGVQHKTDEVVALFLPLKLASQSRFKRGAGLRNNPARMNSLAGGALAEGLADHPKLYLG